MDIDERELDYLRLLAQQYPTIRAASTEIINLNAILNLPKGTEHFLTDIHGEHEAFLHVLKNGSGSIKRKIEEIFANSLVDSEKRSLASLIYYPEQRLPLITKNLENKEEWYRITLFRLIKLCRVISSKYTRARVRKALPDDFAYIIEELLHEQESIGNRQEYYNAIIDTIIAIGRAEAFIIAMAELVQKLAIAHLHIIGDVYDRGPGAHIILDTLMNYHSVDVQWGNHDIVWMGAAAGSEACMASVIRISLRYTNMETLEEGYGISMLPLATFAIQTYADDPCLQFAPKISEEGVYTQNEIRLMTIMQKAIAVIQLKLEGQVIRRHPEFEMDDRLLLDKIDCANGNIDLNGKVYPLNDTNFPTVDPKDPYRLTEQERAVVDRLKLSFTHNEHLQKHVRFLYSKGSMYLVYNGNLLFHGCLIMNPDGTFATYKSDGVEYSMKDFMDRVERLARQGYFATDPDQKQAGLDYMWYLWSGPKSPLYGKDKMATFERYFIDDITPHKETMNSYFDFREQEKTSRRILEAFGLNPDTAHIINGHVPVKVKKGESPVKANGKMLAIDGGFASVYRGQTGIAGYTLIFNSYGLLLAAHNPFQSTQKAIEESMDIHSRTEILERNLIRIRVKDTDQGKIIQRRIDELTSLLQAYREGLIKES